ISPINWATSLRRNKLDENHPIPGGPPVTESDRSRSREPAPKGRVGTAVPGRVRRRLRRAVEPSESTAYDRRTVCVKGHGPLEGPRPRDGGAVPAARASSWTAHGLESGDHRTIRICDGLSIDRRRTPRTEPMLPDQDGQSTRLRSLDAYRGFVMLAMA